MDTSNNSQMEDAIAHLNHQESFNYAAAAMAYGIHPQTLARCHKSLTVSRAEANSTFRQRLNNDVDSAVEESGCALGGKGGGRAADSVTHLSSTSTCSVLTCLLLNNMQTSLLHLGPKWGRMIN
jgi:hypothetical protein